MTTIWPRRVGRTLAACSASALATAVVVLTGGPAMGTGQPIGACTATSGVVLAVDFSHWDGPILRACGTTPTTGYELLNEGGWHTTGDAHDGPAFICRIGYDGYQHGTQYPTPAEDPCVVTPPATAYWSYWHADPGQDTWSYSQLGAMSYHPKPGSIDLWVFGATNIGGTTGLGVPTISPDSVRAHDTSPATPGEHGVGPGLSATTANGAAGSGGAGRSAGPGGRSDSAGGSGARADPTTIGSPGDETSPRRRTPQGSAVTGSATPSGHPPIVNVDPVSATKHVDHSATPAVVALVVIVALGVVGATIALRRPRPDS